MDSTIEQDYNHNLEFYKNAIQKTIKTNIGKAAEYSSSD